LLDRQPVRLILASSTRASWPKKQLTQHRSNLKHFMRSSCLGERQTSMDPRMQFAGREHFDDGPHAHTTLLYKVIPGVDGELPHRRRVLGKPQPNGVPIAMS
jgi:hypothetical protein